MYNDERQGTSINKVKRKLKLTSLTLLTIAVLNCTIYTYIIPSFQQLKCVKKKIHIHIIYINNKNGTEKKNDFFCDTYCLFIASVL